MKFRRFISVLTVASLLLSSVHMTAKTDDVQDYKTQAEYTAETAELNTQKEDTKNVSSTISTVSNATGDIVASGACGANLTWELFSDGTLEINGSGTMHDYYVYISEKSVDYRSSSPSPWYSRSAEIKVVTIGDGVTSIGDWAFYDCSNLTSVTIGDSVTSIGINAFYNCSSLTSVTIPDGVTSIGESTFYNCSSLTSVTIPSSVTSIGKWAFYNCSSLTSVTMGDSVTSIGYSAFYNCSSLVKVYITDIAKLCGISFDSDGSNPLCNGANLYLNGELVKDLTIPDGVTEIKDYAFYNCSSLTSVTMGDGVTNIGSDAFYSCSSLVKVYITDIAKWYGISFYGSHSNPLCNGANLYLNGELVKDLTIPDGVTKIKDYAFEGCSSLTSVTIPDSVTSIGELAFYHCSSLTSVTIGDGVTSIGNWAFADCENLTSVTIPDSVTSIGYGAFESCSSLTSVTIGDGVTSIGGNAFYDCDSLTSVTIPDSVTNIGDDAFSNCDSLMAVTIPDSVTSIGYGAFSGCSSLTSVTIGDSVTSIGDCAFSGCSSLTSVTIPDSVTSIGYDAFYQCSSLESIYITSIESWNNISFYDSHANPFCYAEKMYLNGELVTNLALPDGITTVNNKAFYVIECIKSLMIPEGIVSIQESAFAGCSGIETVTLPKSLVMINDNAFSGCYSIKKVYYAGSKAEWNDVVITSGNDYLKNAEIIYGVNIEGGEDEEETVSYIAVGNLGTAEWALLENGTVIINGKSVPSVNELPFYKYRDTITAVKISEGITAIPEDMFYKCSNITSVIIPASVTKIGDSAFWRCDAITDVYYCGTEAQWANIQIDEYNDILSSCAFTYNYSPVTVKAFKTLTKPQKVTYAYGEELEVDDMHVALFYSNNSFKEVEDFTVSGYDKCTFGRQEVTVSYEDQSFTMDVYVKPTEPSVLTTPMKAGMTVKEFSAPYSMLYTVCVFDDSMCKQLSDDDIITSGCVVQLVRDEKLMDSIGIVVSGDATCDGIVNGKDLIRIKKQINSGDAVEYTEYADINCDGIIDDADLECLIGMM